MTVEVVNAIATMAEANGLPPEAVADLRKLCSGKKHEKVIPITGKEARRIIGAAEGDNRLVSRPYLDSLVKAGRLHQIRLSERKIRYDRVEVEALISTANAKEITYGK